MVQQQPIHVLHQLLQSYGAIRPAAWQKINLLKQEQSLYVKQRFIRKEGSLAYLASGLLQEYDAYQRSTPSIINFITPQHFVVTRKHNQSFYLKAALPSLLYYWDYEQLQQLHQEFKELKAIYDTVCSIYDAAISYRTLILELPSAAARIKLFKEFFETQIPFIKKKDIANYLQLNYTHFLHINNNML